jgi:hypothetical protein
MPGDIFITEMPYEDPEPEDFFPVTNLQQFAAGHVAIWTGNNFTTPLAHSVSEGYKLPGIRLTKIGDGRHVIFRLANQPLAEKIAVIARRWAMSASLDLKRFDKVYPKRFWGEPKNYDRHKHDFFSIRLATTYGPATPYAFERASTQLYDRARKPELNQFTDDSLRRAIKFSSRSELMGPISKGMRCTSFVISVVQAAVLSELTKQTLVKTSFKHYKERPFDEYANAVLSTDWHATERGKQLKSAVQTQNFTAIFPAGMAIDSKYSLPTDILSSLSQSNLEWKLVGSVCIYQNKTLHLINNKKESLIETRSCSSESTEKNPVVKVSSQDELQQQIAQEKSRAARVTLFATPAKKKDLALPSNDRELKDRISCSRTLFS